MSRKRWMLLSIALFFLLAGGIGWWWVYSLMHYDVTEAELGVEVGFFDFNEAIQVPRTGIDFSQRTPSVSTEIDETGSLDTPSSGEPREETNAQKGQASQGLQNSSNPTSAQDASISQSSQDITDDAAPLTSDEKLEIIKEEYTNSFTQLQNLALSRIDILVELAKEEYLQKKDTKGFSKVDLASKYMSAGNKLEHEVTKVFYDVLDQMKKDLQNNQLPLDLVAEAEKIYKDTIKLKKDELLSKVSIR